MADNPYEFGHRFAVHLILERLLARMFEDSPDELAELEAECMAAVDDFSAEGIEQFGRSQIESMSAAVEAIFSGARRLVEGD